MANCLQVAMIRQQALFRPWVMNLAEEVIELTAAHLDAEVIRSHVLNGVGLVKNDGLVLRKQAGSGAAEGKVGLKLNVRLADKERVLQVLREHPKTSLNSPTVASLTDPDWVALETIIDEDIVRHIMPQLYQAGARGIVEYVINKIIE